MGGEIAILQFGQKLALFHVVAAVHIEFLDRRGDLRPHVGLVVGKEYAVAADHVVDGGLRNSGHLDRSGLLGFRFLLLGTRGSKEGDGDQQDRQMPARMRAWQARGPLHERRTIPCIISHWLKRPRECLKIRERHAGPHQAVVITVARIGQGGLCVHHLERGGLAGLVLLQGQLQAVA